MFAPPQGSSFRIQDTKPGEQLVSLRAAHHVIDLGISIVFRKKTSPRAYIAEQTGSCKPCVRRSLGIRRQTSPLAAVRHIKSRSHLLSPTPRPTALFSPAPRLNADPACIPCPTDTPRPRWAASRMVHAQAHPGHQRNHTARKDRWSVSAARTVCGASSSAELLPLTASL